MARQLGVTKVVTMKMQLKDLITKTMKDIKLVQKEVNQGDLAWKNTTALSEQLDSFGKEGENIASYAPKIEELEQDLEMIDKKSHDDEFQGIQQKINTLVQTGKKQLQEKS